MTGSGISAESGIPTFRGQDGYWRNCDPTRLATEQAFAANPQRVWDWYRERRMLIRGSQPNAAHQALVRLAGRAREFLLLTQNVDDLHARAEWNGRRLPADQIVPIHGSIFVTRCSRCDYRLTERDLDSRGVPECPRCAAPLRPGVIWFGEELASAEVERMEAFLTSGECDLVLVIGTTALFGYIVHWTLSARGKAGRMIEVNPEETVISGLANETIRSPAALALPKLVARLIET